ncbi:MAG: hypothetical protein ABFE01_29410 [Phycisphaerales bacterium]
MTMQRNRRGLTRLDALVVGSVGLVLVLLVPVLLAKPRERSSRVVCASNLAQIGKTMFVYAVDNEGALPRAGSPTTTWGPLVNWAGAVPHLAYGLNPDGSGGKATISSSLYLLVKYYQAPPRLFVCPGDKGTTGFKLSKSDIVAASGLSDVWDFGQRDMACRSCSFAYHMPYGKYALTTSRDPNLAVAADRNPWIQSPAGSPANLSMFIPDIPGVTSGTPATGCVGNAVAHGGDGQNVLFLDGKVTFETRSWCGLDSDNIYLLSNGCSGGSIKGTVPTLLSFPGNERDSLLLHDPASWGSGARSSEK